MINETKVHERTIAVAEVVSRSAPENSPQTALIESAVAVLTIVGEGILADESHTQEQAAEIAEARTRNASTIRPTVQGLEAMLHKPFPILDHGFVRVIDYMGDDSAIVQAARVSYGRGTKRVQEDAGLIRYLMRHRHTTPFEMCEIKFHIKLPIFVARQWIRHRTASVNEYSARYSILDKEFYIPAPEHLAAQSVINRQGRGEILDGEEACEVLHLLRSDAERSYASYAHMLNEGETADPNRRGLARELARMNLTLNTYTQWYWKTNLHNLFHFLSLRADPHAQYEIRVYADEMTRMTEAWVPIAAAAFRDYRLGAVTLSAQMVAVLRRMVAGEAVSQATSGLNRREWVEFAEHFQVADRS
jgi:thymidylate synthase (FAD)